MSLPLLLYNYPHPFSSLLTRYLPISLSLYLSVPKRGRAPAASVADGVPQQQQLATSSVLG